jgi:lysozyme
MIINDAGRKIITEEEGCVLEAYVCPAGVLTIGFGHTGDVKKGDKISRHQAEVILEYDLQRFEEAVSRLCPTANANQFSALVSFSFNVGIKAFEGSTLLKLFKAGGPLAAAGQFDKWIYAGKNKDGTPREMKGLKRRRAREKALFLTGVS